MNLYNGTCFFEKWIDKIFLFRIIIDDKHHLLFYYENTQNNYISIDIVSGHILDYIDQTYQASSNILSISR